MLKIKFVMERMERRVKNTMINNKNKKKDVTKKAVEKKTTGKKLMNKKPVEKKPQIQKEWLLLTGEENEVRQIEEVIKEDYETEIWEELGVMEITLPSGSSIDLEEAEVNMKDEALVQKMEQEEAQRIYLVTAGSDNWKEVETVLKKLAEDLDSVFVADTESLTPEIRG